MSSTLLERYLEGRRQHVIAKFWRRVEKTDACWLWRGSLDGFGYGQFSLYPLSTTAKAHRFSWELARGPIPDGLIVRHDCDVPACVNPDHLRLGTKADNAADRDHRGRAGTIGERNRHAKLTAAQVQEIRSRYTGEYGQGSALAREYGISEPALWHIVHGKTWRHLL